MSGEQGAKPPEKKAATTYEWLPSGESRTRTDSFSQEDQGSVQVDQLQEKVLDPVRKVDPTIFGDIDENKDKDPGVTGTGECI